MLSDRLGANKEMEQMIREKVEQQMNEVNWFIMNFGTLSHSSNIFLNSLGHVNTKVAFETRKGFQDDFKEIGNKLGKFKGKLLKNFIKGNYIESVYNFEQIEKDSRAEYERIFTHEFNTAYPTPTDQQKKSLEEFKFEGLDTKVINKILNTHQLWESETYKQSFLNQTFASARREELMKYNEVTQNYQKKYSTRYGEIVSEAEKVNDIPVFTIEQKQQLEDLKKTRIYDKSPFYEGVYRDGILKADAAEYKLDKDGYETDVVKINENLYIKLDTTKAHEDAILAFELNKIDNRRIVDSAKRGNSSKGILNDKFTAIFETLDSEDAYNYLVSNAFIGYSDNYYESLNRPGIIDKLEQAKIDKPTEADEIDSLIKSIAEKTKRQNTILQANREMNNPSEILYDNMDLISEVQEVKELVSQLDYEYSRAYRYLTQEEVENSENNSETIPNRAFLDHLNSLAISIVTIKLDYSDSKILTK
jgi:hypothetical protein